jgi:hypothetical protein
MRPQLAARRRRAVRPACRAAGVAGQATSRSRGSGGLASAGNLGAARGGSCGPYEPNKQYEIDIAYFFFFFDTYTCNILCI